jgi:hypothetical protein
MVGVRGGLVALQSLLTIKKGISPFNFQSKELFLKFLQQLLRFEVPLSKEKKKKFCQHRSLLRQRDCAAYDRYGIETTETLGKLIEYM